MEQDPSTFIPITFPPELLTWIKKEHNIPVFFFKASFYSKQFGPVYLRLKKMSTFCRYKLCCVTKQILIFETVAVRLLCFKPQHKATWTSPGHLWQSTALGGWVSPSCWLSVGTSLLLLFTYLLVGGGFKYSLFSPRKLGKIPILTNIFQMGWNHQLDLCYCCLPLSFGTFTC